MIHDKKYIINKTDAKKLKTNDKKYVSLNLFYELEPILEI